MPAISLHQRGRLACPMLWIYIFTNLPVFRKTAKGFELMNCSKLASVLILLILAASTAYALVPPHPSYRQIPTAYRRSMPELPKGGISAPKGEILNNILVLRVQFPDLAFSNSAAYPDSLVHDEAFFERWMLHLADFYADASRGNYLLEWTMWPQVFTMSRPIAYYGGDTAENIDDKLEEMLVELAAMADPEVDFNQYGGIIVFHSGGGQEADISGLATESIWSTFVTRKNLQAALDPENDDFQGISTADGVFLKNIVIVPEQEYFDYYLDSPETSGYLFSLYGVLCHQYSHLIGLPTLFDNDSSNGRSQGVGNWCILGTGVWNANGYVPAQLSAWGRAYMGWDTPQIINQDAEDLVVDYYLNPDPSHPTIYKIPISNREYFLVENRQQNPDASLDPHDNQPSFSFKLLPEGEQDYYEHYPLRPYFNFMENRYKGCEWDFMLPGLGGPLLPNQSTVTDGSGILIWHIDENIIEANFDPGFEKNRVNGNALHKGVDLEEADGIEHLDTALFDFYMNGGPYDSFRQDNNDYFGTNIVDGLLSLPAATSYYGGTPVEVYDISESALQMSFSVRLDWKLDTYYQGENVFNATWLDLDNDQEQELLYIMPDGSIYAWKNEQLMQGYPLQADSLAYNYTASGSAVYLPQQVQNLARMRKLEGGSLQTVFNQVNTRWAAQPVDIGDELIVCLNPAAENLGTRIMRIEKSNNAMNPFVDLEQRIVANMSYADDKLWMLTKSSGNRYLGMLLDVNTGILEQFTLPIELDSTIVSISTVKLNHGQSSYNLLVQTLKAVYAFDMQMNLIPGYPYIHDRTCTAPLTIADFDRNNSPDIILGTANGVIVLDASGSLVGQTELSSPIPATISSGAMVLDLDNDGRMEIIGSFSNNRLAAWDDGFRLKSGYPVSFPETSRGLPKIGKASDNLWYAWVATDMGRIYRKQLGATAPGSLDSLWITEYANLQRTSSYEPPVQSNVYATNQVFVPGEVYFYPNPLKSIYEQVVRLSVMTSEDGPVELKIYDVSGALVFSQRAIAKAYLRNREIFSIPAARLASGVYLATVKAGNDVKSLRFAIEK